MLGIFMVKSKRIKVFDNNLIKTNFIDVNFNWFYIFKLFLIVIENPIRETAKFLLIPSIFKHILNLVKLKVILCLLSKKNRVIRKKKWTMRIITMNDKPLTSSTDNWKTSQGTSMLLFYNVLLTSSPRTYNTFFY